MASATTDSKFSLLNPFDSLYLDIEHQAGSIKQWAFENRALFRPLREPLDWLISGIEGGLHSLPQLAVLAGFALIALQAAGWRTALLTVFLLTAMGLLSENSWNMGMTTLTIVLVAVLICVLIGLPLGILAGKSDAAQSCLRPLLDTMQTIPAFVYLIPVVLLLGIGNVPGVVVTVVFALPPLVRLTSLGIRQVDPSVVEAMYSFGAKPHQVLFKAQLPLAMPSIMAGLNQTIMLALSMVVIASMISVKGFGNEVLRGIGRLDAGKAIIGGVGIVILAVLLDRISQGISYHKQEPLRRHRHKTASTLAKLAGHLAMTVKRIFIPHSNNKETLP